MFLYLDTSALAKLYVEEEDSARICEIVGQGDSVASSHLSYVEMGSLVYRRLREKRMSKAESIRLMDVFETDWERFGKIPVVMPLLKRSYKLLMAHPLRALDAVHLASALCFQDELAEPITFLSADKQLLRAARQEKLKIPA